MFAVIRHYRFDKKDSAAIDRAIREEFVPIVRKAKGFQSYYWVDTGEGDLVRRLQRQSWRGRISPPRG
jgi:hypothetical protein